MVQLMALFAERGQIGRHVVLRIVVDVMYYQIRPHPSTRLRLPAPLGGPTRNALPAIPIQNRRLDVLEGFCVGFPVLVVTVPGPRHTDAMRLVRARLPTVGRPRGLRSKLGPTLRTVFQGQGLVVWGISRRPTFGAAILGVTRSGHRSCALRTLLRVLDRVVSF